MHKKRYSSEKRKHPFVAFIILLFLMSVFPWAVEYISSSSLIGLSRSFDWGKPIMQSLIIFLISSAYITLGMIRIKQGEVRQTVLNDILAAIPDAVFTQDEDGEITYINHACTDLLKYNPSEVIGKKSAEILGKQVNKIMRKCVERRKIIPEEVTVLSKDKQEISVTITTAVLKDRKDKVIGALALMRDLRREKQMYARLIQAEKLASLGQLAASITHEINQPLNAIRMLSTNFLSMIEDGEDIGKEQLSKTLDIIQKEVYRTSNLTHQVLEYASISGGREKIQMNTIIRDVLTLVEPPLVLEGFEINREKLRDELPLVNVNKNRLKEVFINLIQNAKEATNVAFDQGKTGEKKLIFKSFTQGDNVVVTVSDTGGGIPEEIRDKIFSPFFTSKRLSGGTGLGLNICKEIMESLGGKISLEVENNVGATFFISLPKAK